MLLSQCSSLRFIFGSSTVLLQGTSEYDGFTNLYWSAQQASVDPYCVFKPTKTLDVSTLVLLSRLTQCPFAVKSGGHAAFAGASNIQGGITVSLENMKAIKLSSDYKIASIEPGNNWHDVYTKLESHNLAVIGGRVSSLTRKLNMCSKLNRPRFPTSGLVALLLEVVSHSSQTSLGWRAIMLHPSRL